MRYFCSKTTGASVVLYVYMYLTSIGCLSKVTKTTVHGFPMTDNNIHLISRFHCYM